MAGVNIASLYLTLWAVFLHNRGSLPDSRTSGTRRSLLNLRHLVRPLCTKFLPTVNPMAALFFYDYILTFSREVKYIWQRRFSGVTALFLLNRYVIMLSRTASFIQLQSWRDSTPQKADFVSRPTSCGAYSIDLDIANYVAVRCTTVFYVFVSNPVTSAVT